MTPVAATDITPTSNATWQTKDLTSYLGSDAGSVAGVVLEFNTTGTSSRSVGARKKGSTDTLNGVLQSGGRCYLWCGVDSNDECEIYISNKDAGEKVYLVGYYKTDEAVFFTNNVDKSIATAAAWTDIDISSDTGADTAIAAIFQVKNVSGGVMSLGLRNDGSSFTGSQSWAAYQFQGMIIGLTSEICEFYQQYDGTELRLVGYLKDNFVAYDYIDKSQSSYLSYNDIDCSGNIASDANGVYLWFKYTSTSAYSFARKNGSSEDRKLKERGINIWCEVDSNKIYEQYIESSTQDTYIIGCSKASGAAPAAARKPLQSYRR